MFSNMLCSAGRYLQPLGSEDIVLHELSPGLLKTNSETTMGEIDRVEQWKRLVADRASLASGHAGAGTGRHTMPLAERLEWVTAVEPSEGMRAHIAQRDNITIVASTWEDAEVAPADLVICSHVMYGVADPVPFIDKMQRSARERVFVMMRESDLPHPAAELRRRLAGATGPRLPRFSELFMLLIQIGAAADVTFLRYPIVTRYAGMDEALIDCRALYGEGWDEEAARQALEEILIRDGDELVYDGGVALSGVAHWQPRTSS